MEDVWKGTDYITCPTCKQVVRKELLANGKHSCGVNPQSSLGIWD